MSGLLGFINGAIAHEGDKRKFINVLGNPTSSLEARVNAYTGLMIIANRQDWFWLMGQFEQNLGELNSRVMDPFFAGAAKYCRERLADFVAAEDGIVAVSVKAINSFTEIGGAAIFMVHRALSAMEALGMIEELRAFASFVVMVCENKANNGLVPRKLFEERLKQYLSADVVDDQEQRFQQLVANRKPVSNGGDRSYKGLEGRRPIPPEKYARPVKVVSGGTQKDDDSIDAEGRRVAAEIAKRPTNNTLATRLTAAGVVPTAQVQ